MKDFFIQLLTVLVIFLGGAFFLKGKLKNPFRKGKETIIPPGINPLPKPPDIEKIREEFKNETPKESAHHVTDMLHKLFPRN